MHFIRDNLGSRGSTRPVPERNTVLQCYLFFAEDNLLIQAYPDASLEATNSAIRPWDIQDYSRQM